MVSSQIPTQKTLEMTCLFSQPLANGGLSHS